MSLSCSRVGRLGLGLFTHCGAVHPSSLPFAIWPVQLVLSTKVCIELHIIGQGGVRLLAPALDWPLSSSLFVECVGGVGGASWTIRFGLQVAFAHLGGTYFWLGADLGLACVVWLDVWWLGST